jgi:hypothetical protein
VSINAQEQTIVLDVIAVAGGAVTVISPFLPYLKPLGNKIQNKLEDVIAEQGGNLVWEQAQKLWSKIKDHFQDDSKVMRAAESLSEDPEDSDYKQKLIKELAKKLESDQELAKQLQGLMGGEAGVQRVAAGNEALIEVIRQEMASSGTQEVKAGDKSIIRDVGMKQG